MDSRKKKGYRKATHVNDDALTLRRSKEKLKNDLGKFNLSKSGLRRALLQLTTKSYVVVDRLSKKIVRGIDDKDNGTQGFAGRTKFLPSLDANKYNQKGGERKKKGLNDSENIRKSSKYSDEINDRLDADRIADNRTKIHGIKFQDKIKRRKECSSDKYKVKRCKLKCDREESNTLTGNDDTNTRQVPIKINDKVVKRLRPILAEEEEEEEEEEESRETKFSEDESRLCGGPKVMEADSALSSDKKKDYLNVENGGTDITELKIMRRYGPRETVIIDKIRKNCNISDNSNRTYTNVNDRKRKKIRAKFHEIFGRCLTISEEEEEESIINASMLKRRRKRSERSSNVSTNIDSSLFLNNTETRDITSDFVQDIVRKRTCEIASIELVETLLNTNDVIEFNKNQTLCDKDLFTMETKLCEDDSVERDLSNESSIKTANVSAMDDVAKVALIRTEDDAARECLQEPDKLTETIDVKTDTLPHFTLCNGHFNDTNVKALTDYPIKITSNNSNNSDSNSNSNGNSNSNNSDSSSDSSGDSSNGGSSSGSSSSSSSSPSNNDDDDDDDDNNNNNDDDKMNRYVSKNSRGKEVQLDGDSGGSCVKTTIINPIVNAADASVVKILEKSRDGGNLSKTSKMDRSFDTPKKMESATTIANVHLTESRARNINDSNAEIEIGVKPYGETLGNTRKNSNEYEGNIVNDNINKKSGEEDTSEDLSQLLQMNIDENYRVRSIGNTISIEENLETHSSCRNTMTKEIRIGDVKDKENRLISDNSTERNEEIEGGEEEESLRSDVKDDKTNDSKGHTTISLDPPCNIVRANAIQRNKIRVLSSAELGSRWCPTPVDASLTKPRNVSLDETIIDIDINVTDTTPSERTDVKRSTKDPSLPYLQFYLMSIHRRIMRIREVEKQFSSNDRRYVSGQVKNLLNDDMQFNSNFIVLIEELLHLGKELKMSDLRNVIRYATSVINDHFLSPEYKPISLEEIFNYMTVFDKSISKKTFTFASNNTPVSVSSDASFTFTRNDASSKSSCGNVPSTTFTFGNAFTSTTSNNVLLSASIAPVSNLSNNPNNVAQAVLSNVTNNLHVVPPPPPTEILPPICNDLPKKSLYASVPPKQGGGGQACVVTTLQTLKKSDASILYAPPVLRSMHKNVQLSKENPTTTSSSSSSSSSSSVPCRYGRGAVTFYNAPAADSNFAQSHDDNKYTTRRANLNKNVQSFVGNDDGPGYDASEMPPQSWNGGTADGRIDNSRDTSTTTKSSYTGGERENGRTQRIAMSYNAPQILPIQMARNIENSQISCSMTLSTRIPMVHYNNSQNLLHRMDKIPYELLLRIWDQVTFCLEESLFDCRPHEIYDKGSCILKLFHIGWKERIYKFIRYKSQRSESMTLRSKLAKYIYKTAVPETQKRIWQLYFPKRESQKRSDTIKILIKDTLNKNYLSSVNLESRYVSTTEASQSKSQKEVDDVELEKRSNLHSLQNVPGDIFKGDAVSSILQNNNHNNNYYYYSLPVDDKSVSSNEMDRDEGIRRNDAMGGGGAFTTLLNNMLESREESNEILSDSRSNDIRLEEFQEARTRKKKEGSSAKLYITDNTADRRRFDSTERGGGGGGGGGGISSEPHIIDVRSISPTSFDTMEEVLPFPTNDLTLSITEDTKQNGIQIQIQIPEDVICLNCPKISTVVCELCLKAHYCSKECAASHWIDKHHKYCTPPRRVGVSEEKV